MKTKAGLPAGRQGMTMIEAIVAIGLTLLIGTAIIAIVVSALVSANSARLRLLGTACAQKKLEEIKAAEQTNKIAIQNGDFSSISSFVGIDNCQLAGSKTNNFFTRTVSPLGTVTGGKSVIIQVSWSERGKTVGPLTFTTYVTSWK